MLEGEGDRPFGQVGQPLVTSSSRACHTHHATGDLSAARNAWAEALAIVENLHHLPAALEVRAKLRDLGAFTL